MSVLTYLEQRASNAVLSTAEKTSIATSIATLSSRMDGYFTVAGNGLADKFQFGSSTRGTILPRAMDSNSDIDYLVVFEKGGFVPQTYLDRLKAFIEKKYSSSEVYQSSPTVVLDLNHIKFELVPALHYYGTTYRIPDGTSNWRETNPNDFNATLETANKNNSSLIKPTVRLAKLWNVANGYVFDSYLFEKWIASQSFYYCANQRDYLFHLFDILLANQSAAWRNDKIKRAKQLVQNVMDFESRAMPRSAEEEVKKLIPVAE
jgi:hypothetical protein